MTKTPGMAMLVLGMLFAHADALEVACDPAKMLQTLELRATCSEGVLGLLGMTVVQE